MEVSLFTTCLVDQFFPEVGLSTVKLLRKLGVNVTVDSQQTCCGQPAFNSGYVPEARKVARHFLNVYRDSEYIVIPSGSCASMIKIHIPELFDPGSEDGHLAHAIAGKSFELSDFLVSKLGITSTGACFPHRVTFHDSCHQLRELRISSQPRKLIQAIEKIDFVEMIESERCCGFGGTFSVKFPEVSVEMGRSKLKSVLDSGAEFVIANDVSCLMHLQGLIQREKLALRTMHIAELLTK
jgi:L-lactate dehydrogenase complex protein LldE